MGERKIDGLSKSDALNALGNCIKRDTSGEGRLSDTNSKSMDYYESLATRLGASEYEIIETWFSHTSLNKNDLLGVYCEKLNNDKDFESFEELRAWSENMKNIANRFGLTDPLNSAAKYPTSKNEDLKYSEAFVNVKGKQELFDLYSLRIINDGSFPNLGEVKKWAVEMVSIIKKYHLKDHLKEIEDTYRRNQNKRPE